MKTKGEILYTNLIEYLQRIIENAENYDCSEELFERLISKFDELKTNLNNSKNNNELFIFPENAEEIINNFNDNYNNFPDWSKSKILSLYEIVKRILGKINEFTETGNFYDLTTEINFCIFNLHTINFTDKIRINNSDYGDTFYIQDNIDFSNSILLFDFENISKSLNIFDTSNFEILFHLLEKLSVVQSFQTNQILLIKENTLSLCEKIN